MHGFLAIVFLLLMPTVFKVLFIMIVAKIAWPLAIIITFYLFWKWA